MILLHPRANLKIERTPVTDAGVREEVLGILAQFMDVTEDLQVQNLAIGGQAQVFAVRRPAGAPVCHGHAELVVKRFYPDPEVRQAVETGYESMAKLAAAVDGRDVHGWTLRSPEPLHRSHSPFALVTSLVPGTSLASRVERNGHCDDVADIVAEALLRFWDEAGILYGDLTLHNILVDDASRSISFVDCGAPQRVWYCDGVARDWYPASRDLAYLMYSLASAVRAYLGKPAIRHLHMTAAEILIRRCVDRLAVGADRAGLVNEIGACARFHAGKIRKGIWRSIVKRQSLQIIDLTTSKLHRAVGLPGLSGAGQAAS